MRFFKIVALMVVIHIFTSSMMRYVEPPCPGQCLMLAQHDEKQACDGQRIEIG